MFRRNILQSILDALSDTPVAFLRGARQTGKLSASPSSKDFAGLKVLREHLGEKFVSGLLVYTGTQIVPFGDRLFAVPISVLSGL